jgi:N-carbamoyl-L-amino-acid hydrolase
MMRVDLDRLRRDVEGLAEIGRDPSGGWSRPAWSPPHEEARAWLLARLRAAGLETRVDAAGNVFGRLPGGDPGAACVMTGSHIDTVPRGGPLDGALGVLAGLECLRAIKAAGVALARPLEVAAFSDEEGRFYGLFGSRAMTGGLDLELAARLRDPDGLPLPEAMRRAGFDLARAPEARRDPRTIAAYVELHIEQGPWLEEAGVPIGVVEAIVGIRRHRLTFLGQPDHAGATPMDRRRDAFFAAADYATRSRAAVLRGGRGRAVTTIGVVQVEPGVANIVPARAALLQELRDPDPKVLDRLARRRPASRPRRRGRGADARRADADGAARDDGDRGRGRGARPRDPPDALGGRARRPGAGGGDRGRHGVRAQPGRAEPPPRRVDRLAGDRAGRERAARRPATAGRLPCRSAEASGIMRDLLTFFVR